MNIYGICKYSHWSNSADPKDQCTITDGSKNGGFGLSADSGLDTGKPLNRLQRCRENQPRKYYYEILNQNMSNGRLTPTALLPQSTPPANLCTAENPEGFKKRPAASARSISIRRGATLSQPRRRVFADHRAFA